MTNNTTRQHWAVKPHLDEMIDMHGDRVLALRELACGLPGIDKYAHRIEYNLATGEMALDAETAPSDLRHEWENTLLKAAGVYSLSEKCAAFLTKLDSDWLLVKQSYSPTLRTITDALSFTDGPLNQWYGGPKPLASMLLGSLAGAGTGYLGGAAAENFMGGQALRKGRLRRNLALAGAVLGAVPGATIGGIGHYHHGPAAWFSDDAWKSPIINVSDKAKEAADIVPCLPIKLAAFNDFQSKTIDVDDFGDRLWSPNDTLTPPALRASALGLVDSAAQLRPGSDVVTAADVARIAVGMGTGYASARLVGGALGALAGLTPQAQSKLQQTGVWTGILKTVVPLAFGQG